MRALSTSTGEFTAFTYNFAYTTYKRRVTLICTIHSPLATVRTVFVSVVGAPGTCLCTTGSPVTSVSTVPLLYELYCSTSSTVLHCFSALLLYRTALC